MTTHSSHTHLLGRARRTALALAVGLLALPAGAQAQDAVFTDAADVVVGADAEPRGTALGDFNSDGRQDVAIAGYGANRVFVRLGNGDGTFRVSGSTTGIGRPERVAVADFDRDGIEDLAVTGRVGPGGSHDVEILRGRGDGAFVHALPTVNLVDAAQSLEVADINGDGREDFVAAVRDWVSVRLGRGDGTFVGGDVVVQGASATAVEDFDGDGRLDIVVAMSAVGRRLVVMRGRGDGNFDAPRPIAVPNGAGQLAVGDFNDDARPDLAVSIPVESRVSILLGRGDLTFSDDASDLATGGAPRELVVGDLNSDGRDDLVVAGGDRDAVDVRLGEGSGRFREAPAVPVGTAHTSPVLGDLDGNGRADLAVARSAGSVSIRLGSGESPLQGNLLVNGGFERGFPARLPAQSPSIPGWTTTGGMTFVRYGASPRVGFPAWNAAPRWSGGTAFLWGGDSTGLGGVTTATQTVDIASSAEAIDQGRAKARLSAYLGGGSYYQDHMGVTAQFLGAAGEELGKVALDPVTNGARRNVTTLLPRAAEAPVPAGTRAIRVTATSTDTDTISSAIADNVKLTVDGVPAGPDPVEPQPQPEPARPSFGPDTNVTVRLAKRRIGRKGAVRVRLSNANEFAVAGSVAARGAVRLAAKPVTVAGNAAATVKLALPRKLRGKLRRRGRLGLRLVAVVRDPAGNSRTIRARVSVRARARA
jgi:hypothetical protein